MIKNSRVDSSCLAAIKFNKILGFFRRQKLQPSTWINALYTFYQETRVYRQDLVFMLIMFWVEPGSLQRVLGQYNIEDLFVCWHLEWVEMNNEWRKGMAWGHSPPLGAAGVALWAKSRASLILCVLSLHWLSSSDQDWGAIGIGLCPS